jgi:hypothetical protein
MFAHLAALKYRDLQVLAKEYFRKAKMKSSEIVAQLLQKGYTHVTSHPTCVLMRTLSVGQGGR